MKYVPLEEAGQLELLYSGDPLDLTCVATLQVAVRDIAEVIAVDLLRRNRILRGQFPRRHSPWGRPGWSDAPLIRLQPTHLSLGSLVETVAFVLPVMLADPDVRAVLQNLAANIIWSICASRVRGVRHRNESDSEARALRDSRVDVDEALRGLIFALAQNGCGRLTFKHRRRNGETLEVHLEINDRDH